MYTVWRVTSQLLLSWGTYYSTRMLSLIKVPQFGCRQVLTRIALYIRTCSPRTLMGKKWNATGRKKDNQNALSAWQIHTLWRLNHWACKHATRFCIGSCSPTSLFSKIGCGNSGIQWIQYRPRFGYVRRDFEGGKKGRKHHKTHVYFYGHKRCCHHFPRNPSG